MIAHEKRKSEGKLQEKKKGIVKTRARWGTRCEPQASQLAPWHPRKHNQFLSDTIKRSSISYTYLGESGAIMKAP
jgi:hypothetical protein